MSEFKIKITNEADLSGAKAEEEELKKVADEAEKAHGKIQEGQHKIELGHREMRESLGAVGRAFGGLADVGLWLSPITAALAAVLWTVDKLKEHFAALNDKILEYIQTSREIRSDHMEAMEAATRATADAMAEYARQARSAAEAQDDQNTAMQNRIALNEAYIDGLKKVEEAEEKAYEAEVERDVASGRISQQEGQRRKDVAREKLDADTANLDPQKEQQRIAEHQRQLDEANARIPKEQAARDAALAVAEHPSVTAADTKKEIERQSKILGEQNKKVAASLAEADQHRTPGTFSRMEDDTADRLAGKPVGTMGAASAKLAERQAAQDQKLADATAAYIRSLQSKQDASDQAVKDAKAEADVQNKKLEKDQEIVRTAPDRIEQEKKLAQIHADSQSATLQWQRRADETREATTGIEHRKGTRGGPGSDADRREQADTQSQSASAHEAGPDAALDSQQAIARARTIEANMRGQSPQGRSPGGMAELHDLLNRIIGLQENHAYELNSQRGQLSEQRSRIQALESSSAVSRYGQ